MYKCPLSSSYAQYTFHSFLQRHRSLWNGLLDGKAHESRQNKDNYELEQIRNELHYYSFQTHKSPGLRDSIPPDLMGIDSWPLADLSGHLYLTKKVNRSKIDNMITSPYL